MTAFLHSHIRPQKGSRMALAPEESTPAHAKTLSALEVHRRDLEFMDFLRRRLGELNERPRVEPMTAEEFLSEHPLSDS